MRALVCSALLACIACSGGNGSSLGGDAGEPVNPCATKSATYLDTLTQQGGGTCGPISSQVVNVNADGTVTLPSSFTCASWTVTGCTSRATDCTFTSQGYTFTETFESTFASDGSTASGIVTLTGTGNGASCSSTYNVTATRQ